MHHKPVTKPLEKVPGHSCLFRRGARYYFRLAVPANLRPIVGRRELVKSLETADYALAVERVVLEEQAGRETLRSARAKLKPSASTSDKPKYRAPLVITSEKHAEELARQWFVEMERDGARWWTENRQQISRADRVEILSDLWRSENSITGEREDQLHQNDYNDGKREVNCFLQIKNFSLDENSEGFAWLARFLREARLEYVRRQQDRIEGKPMREYAPLFRDLTENSPLIPVKKGYTVKQLTSKYVQELEKAGKAAKTVFQYQVTARLLCQIFGEDREADLISRDDAEKFCTLLETMPAQMSKRYPKLGIEEAIEAARKRKDHSGLAPNSRRNRFFAAFTIFKHAKESKRVAENPFDDRLLKQRFTPKGNDTPGGEIRPFSLEELCKIFRAPLYTGCMDDAHGYAKPGPNVYRRGRFWVPLLGLFQGMRLNEICQLHTADVRDWSGGLYLEICPGEDKRLKNSASKRAIPVHPELLKLGFADYVAARRADSDSFLLFPDLTKAKTGSYSDNFSKWFGNFLQKVFGLKLAPTFHSFRHAFTDACRVADLSPQRIDRLCGWAGAGRQQRDYGRDKLIAELAEDLSRVGYKGLDLSHLYPNKVQPVAKAPACRVRKRPIPSLQGER